ncbi:MAG: aldehyde ferredoxin oxidoreductase N-terminal domain-containing protein [Thermodesulfobacteriota bacterium]|nr:aldehyde ferredoxin oxidoreductase N-terminal domain-containing protein [Thermodesulfobacteriota bacterium]
MALNRKIAYIDLNRKKIDITPIPLQWRRRFLGGRGIGAYLLLKHASPKCDALGSDNVIVISTGLLGGTLATLSGCTFVMAKSPLSNLLCNVQLKGLFASEIRWAGFDHLVITGCARRPVYLYINNGTVEIRDAKKVWGKNVSKAHEQIRQELKNEDIRMIGIGPSGENLVRFATLTTDENAISGRTGIGAVFGSKNIKTVVCRGTMDLEIKRPDDVLKFKTKNAGQADDIQKKNVTQTDQLEQKIAIRDITPSKLTDCGFNSFAESKFLTRELGMDPLAVSGMLNWAFTLFEKGNLKANKANSLKFNPENPDSVGEMIKHIAYRKGVGNILAKGSFRAAAIIGYSSLNYFAPVKWLIKLYSEDPLPANFASLMPTGKDTDIVEPDGLEPLEGNAGSITLDEINEMILNCLGIFVEKGLVSLFDGDPLKRLIEQIRFNTGLNFDANELKKIACRCYALERLFNIGEEVTWRNDFHPDCSFDVPSGLEMTGPMWDSIDLKEFKRKVSKYYRQRRWSKKDLLKAGVFKKLEIDDLWPSLRR